ncbi:amino acid ABC transporter membrane protein 2 (PAAT family) [Stella humosa]|uniref:Amino acid ABC transporter membrane protein 2 (PAAT family) n=1 Tax=Stella humosa TaxID=94 RepID=A0A3N1ML64_9PROT|nr:amino acid ABC transporter permease [Stella humosa]ROQ01736.1 amino acid ABC transporter membrane protein 2 (PAAT family) [Stella humosa]BBK32118.1 amino acid ABC transporter permease [Stella humosa]
MWAIVEENWLLFLIGQYPHGPIGGLTVTVILALLGLILSFPCALALALARLSPFRWLRWPAVAIIYAVRGVPLLMLLFWAYFFVPIVTGQAVSGFTTLLCALVIYESAYLSEIIRAGIEGIPAGQTEAAKSLGLRYFPTMYKIILPQALFNMLPSMVNQFVSLIKSTSVGYIISVNEITFAAYQVNNRLLTKPFEVYGLLALTFFVLCFALTRLAKLLERRIGTRRAGQVAEAA